jgi:hypothetical protein
LARLVLFFERLIPSAVFEVENLFRACNSHITGAGSTLSSGGFLEGLMACGKQAAEPAAAAVWHLQPLEPINFDFPEDFWLRVRPSPLMATLAVNMCTAADKAHRSGRLQKAEAKYDKAVCYLTPSLGQYTEDAEMLEWTEELLRRLEWRKESLAGNASSSRAETAANSVDFTFGSRLRYAADATYCLTLVPRSNQGPRGRYN